MAPTQSRVWIAFPAATLIACSPARAQLGPVQHIQVGPLDRAYALERFHSDQAPGRVPVVISLHGLGTLISEGVPPRYAIPFTSQPGMAEVMFYRVDGSGHSVPSMAPLGPEGWEASGRRNQDMETARVLWEFFQSCDLQR